MMQFIRDHANSKFAKFLFLGIGISFLGWGGSGFFGQSGVTDVAKVNGEKINQYQVQQEYTSLVNQMASGRTLNEDEMRQAKQFALKTIVERTVLAQKLNEWGLEVSDEDVANAIRSESWFFDESGAFSRDIYRQMLMRSGYTEEAYEATKRTSLALQMLLGSIEDTVFISDTMLDDYAKFDKERRSMEIAKVAFNDYRDELTISDEEIKAEYDKNAKEYQTKERVKIAYIELNKEEEGQITISDDELQKALNDAKKAQDLAETRNSDQLIIQFDNDQEKEAALATLNKIYNDISSAEVSFDEAKKTIEATQDGLYFETGIIKNDGGDSLFNKTLFSLTQETPISEPFVQDNAVHIVRLLDIESNRISDDELKEQTLLALKKEKVEKEYTEKEAQLQELSEQHTDNLNAISEALSVSIQETNWLVLDDATGLLASEKVKEALLTDSVMKEGLNSMPFVDDGKAMMLRVLGHEPIRQMTFEEAKSVITERLSQEKLMDIVMAKVERLKATYNESQTSFKETAKELGLTHYQYNDLMMSDVTKIPEPDEFKIMSVISAFKAPAPQGEEKSIFVETLNEGVAVSVINKITGGSISDYSEEEKNARIELLRTQMKNVEVVAFIQGLIEASKIEFYNNAYMNE